MTTEPYQERIVAKDYEFLNPDEHPAPLRKKIQLLTNGGVAVYGFWSDDCIAWAPLPRVPESIKRRVASSSKLG